MPVPPVSSFGGYSPSRPPAIRDVELSINGDLNFLGVIVSGGAAVDNATTAIPFNQTAVGAGTLNGTLVGKSLLIQPTAAGFVLASALPLTTPGGVGLTTVTTFASTGPFTITAPGAKIQAEERVNFFMMQNKGWLQFIPVTSGNLFVWELI